MVGWEEVACPCGEWAVAGQRRGARVIPDPEADADAASLLPSSVGADHTPGGAGASGSIIGTARGRFYLVHFHLYQRLVAASTTYMYA